MFRGPAIAWCCALLLATAPAAAQDALRFAIHEFEIEGTAVLPAAAIEAAVLPFMGDDRSLKDVEAARAALEKAYQTAGFLTVFVDVPEQRVDLAVVRLRVVEGRVERLRVTGSRYVDQGVIRERVAELAPGRVPDFNVVQQQLAAVNREERRIQPVLRPGIEPGTVEVELKVADRLPLSWGVELSNRHAADTEPWRAQGTVRYDNLFQRDHSLALTFATAPQAPAQSKVLIANYTAPLSGGWSFAGYALLSDSAVEPLGAALVLGKGTTLGARWLYAAGTPDAFHSVAFGLDLKDLKEDLVAGADGLSTPLRYAPLQASYTGNWPGQASSWSLTTSLVAGVRGWLVRRIDCPGNIGAVDQFACKREGADGGFVYWRGDLRHTRRVEGLPGQWALRLGWQASAQPLVPSEQFAIGGAETVRGYLEAEASGDSALLGSIEWRAELPSATLSAIGVGGLTGLAFVDAARSSIHQPGAGQQARVPLLGLGVGLRARAGSQWTGELDIAWPRKPTRASPDASPRVHVRLAGQF